ncbi:MAG: glycoside hydrolase family 3 C-terminal domain-containing protein [Oscillospiraceae bacterium]|nr:glycoside hydrolase family 3 C-terminal domain-containing protein [Oscillospiraceae bacterium]
MNIERIIGKLTLEEKAALLQGWTTWTTRDVPRLNIPAIFLADGPHGMRKQTDIEDRIGLNESVPATCFPTAAAMANSWDPELGQEMGRALGREAAAMDVHVVLGPGLNMKRSPLCGRNFEYYSEDPYLAGKMAAALIRGIQEEGPAACAKHFAVNSQELRRMSTDSVVDERTLREIYLTGFEIAVREGHVKSIMSSYNMVNGTYANENAHLLTEILRDEWGYDGFVMTDWGADNVHSAGVRSGSNLVMPAPGPDCAVGLLKDLEAGKVTEEEIDRRVRELLNVAFRVHDSVSRAPKTFDADAHHAIARKCAESAIVLLDNDGILPLAPDASVAVIGDFAKTPRYQGAGSSQVNPTRLDSFLDCAKAAGLNITGYAQGFSRTDPAPQNALIEEAVELAKKAETLLLFVGLDEIMESEGSDRLHMEISRGQQTLINAVAEVNRNVVLVLSGGSPFEMPDRGLYRAAIHGYLGGQAGAGAMVNVLTGRVNPSGKLSESWPHKLKENPSHPWFPGEERTVEYREGLYIGYRYYDTAAVSVRYPFGHGLSYTNFVYSGISAAKDAVTFTITNTGEVDGAEVAQVYVSCPGGKVFRPRKELKGFAKVFLKAGQSRTVTVKLDDKAFRYFNVATNRWEVETADYEIIVAASVSDVRLNTVLHIDGTNAPTPYGSLPAYESGKIMAVSDAEFEALLGRPIPDGHWGGTLDRNDTVRQMYYAKSPLARLVYRYLTRKVDKMQISGEPDLAIMMIYNMPFRTMAKMSAGLISDKMVDDILLIVNGHFFPGAPRLIRHWFANRKANKEFVKKLHIE